MSRISRRTVLRGAGVAMALPWLESLPAWGDAHPTAAPFPKRFGVLFMGNGINGNHWWAKGSGASMTLGTSLAPLEPLKKKITVINGLVNKPAVGIGIHPAQTGCLLSGVPDSEGTDRQGGDHRRPGSRQPRGPGHAAVEHRAGVRAAGGRPSRDEFLDGLQLAYFVAAAPRCRRPSRSPLRWRSTTCSRTAAASTTSAFSTGSENTPPACAAGSAPATTPDWTSI